jgi:hypothetical protein
MRLYDYINEHELTHSSFFQLKNLNNKYEDIS